MFDQSFAPVPKSDERFARQYRYELPPEFPLASPCSGIDHHLSGPNRYALTQIFRKRTIGRQCLPPEGEIPTLGIICPLLSLRIRVSHPNTRIYVRLLGPCFKTGGRKPFRQHREPTPTDTIQSSIHLSHRQNFVLSCTRANRPQSVVPFSSGGGLLSSLRANVGCEG